MISVIIPLYNKSYSVVRCLQSVLNQTVLPKEVIIVNDGSTDDSLIVVNSFVQNLGCNDSSVSICIINQVNQGVSVARNNGIASAISSYIALLDADDFWQPEFLERIIACIKLYPRLALYTCKHEICVDGYRFVPTQVFSSEFVSMGLIDNYFLRAARYEIVNSSKVVVYKPYFDSVGGFPIDAKLCEDLYLWARLSEIERFGFVNYLGAIIYQETDASRYARNHTQPYILEFYFNNPQLVTDEVRSYLWTVYRNHLRLSILNGSFKEFISRWQFGYRFFKPQSFLLLIYVLLPSKLMRFLKRVKIVMSKEFF